MKQLTDEVFAQVREALAMNRVMGRDENGNYTRDCTPKKITAALAALDTEQPVQVNAMLVEALEAAEKLEHEALVALSEATYELKVGNTYTMATDTYKANNDLIHRLDKVLNSQYRDRKRAALTAAQQAQPEQRPTDDALWDETMKDRDAYHQFADDLAAQIAAITGVDIGEHSNMNNPWQEAMLAADDFIATQIKTLLTQQAQPERAPLPISNWQDEAYAKLDALCDKMSGQDTIVVQRFIRRDIGPSPVDPAIKQGGQHE